MKRWYGWSTLLALGAILFVAIVGDARALRLVRYPYIQNVTQDSVVIVWTTDQPGDSIVEYGVTPEYGLSAQGEPNATKHVVGLTDLSPDTVYYYRVRTGTVSSNGDTFKTANPSEKSHFKMVVFGDSGDCTLRFPGLAQVLLATRINRLAPDLILHTGDVVYPNGEQWGYDRCHFPVYQDTMKSVPMFPSPGNHDYRAPSFLEPYLDNFIVPENASNPDHIGRYYSFDYGNAHVVALDTELPYGGVANADQQQWLEDDLRNTTDAAWKFIFFHRPPYSSGNAGSSMTVRNIIAPLAERYNVDVVFAGHDHDYERTYPLLNNEVSSCGVVYIVTGGGGAMLARVGRSHWTAFSASMYHVTEARIENHILTLEPVEIGGRRRDRYTLSKGTLTGTVINTRGQALPNATLTVLLDRRRRAMMRSLSDGSFHFYLAEGRYDVSVSSPRCETQSQAGIQIAGETDTVAKFVLRCQ